MVLASITTTAIALTILGVFVAVGWQIYAVLEGAPRRLEVHAFIHTAVSREQAELLAADVRRIPGVNEVRLIPKEQAWTEFKKSSDHADVLAGFDENPLPDKLEITAASPEQALEISRQVKELPAVETVKDRADVLRQLITIFNVARTVGLVLAGVMLMGTAAIISNAIRLTLFARRRDIRVMQLVGATDGFIRIPFILEGVLAGLLGGGLACAILAASLHYYSLNILPRMPLVNQFQPTVSLPMLAASLVLGGAFIGLLGSFFSLRRFLRVGAGS